MPINRERLALEHYSAVPLTEIHSVEQSDENDWRGKPRGLWVSVPGEDDWASWCEVESFGIGRARNVLSLTDAHNVLIISGANQLSAFDKEYGEWGKIFPSMSYDKRWIDWRKVAQRYDGIIIAPYQWRHRLDTQVSDWYYGWDCASGCIWNNTALEISHQGAMIQAGREE